MKSKNPDYIKFFKPIMIVFCLLIIASAIVFGLLGFNKGVDFSGGTQLVVQFELTDVDIEKDAELEKASNDVRKILNDSKISVESFQVQGNYGSKSFVIIFKETNEDVLKLVRTSLNEKFNTSDVFLELVSQGKAGEIIGEAEDITRQTTALSGFVGSTTLLTTIACVAFALVVLLVYASFRISVAGALSMLFTAVFSVVGMLAVAVVARIEINRYIFALSAILAVASVASSADLFFTIKDRSNDQNYENYTNYDLANLAVSQTIKKRTLIYTFALFGLFAFDILLSRALSRLSFLSIIGIALTYYASVYVAPGFYAMINKKRTKFVPQKVVEQNPDDKTAEVIEVKE